MEENHARIKERLSDTKDRLGSRGIESRIYTHAYKDGQIDGEIAVFVPRGTNAADVSWKLEEAFQLEPFGLGRSFVSLGTRLSIHKDEAEDRSGTSRVRGMDDMQMYYRAFNTTRLGDSFRRSRKYMIPGAEKKYRRKVEIVYLRIHWNPDHERPKR